MPTIQERLERQREVTPNGCWLWTGHLMNEGYGHISVAGSMKLVHRAAYEAYVGPIPVGRVLDHLCRNRTCHNPEHLEPVSDRENAMRSPFTLASINSAKTNCPQGHPYSPENTHVWRHTTRATTERRCRACKREYDARRRAAKASA